MDVYIFMNFDKICPVNFSLYVFIKTNNQNKQKSDFVIKAASLYSFLRRMATKMVKLVTAEKIFCPCTQLKNYCSVFLSKSRAFNNFN